MVLEYGIEQYKCLHGSWGKTNDGIETYWKMTIEIKLKNRLAQLKTGKE